MRTLAAALLLLAAAPAPGVEDRFRADDWPGALAEAKARKLPIFVEVWVPW